MDEKVVILIVGTAISLFIGIWVVVTVYNTMSALPVVSTAVVNESINFAVNNTWYATVNDRVQSITSVQNASFVLSSGNYSFDTYNVKLTLNCGGVAGKCLVGTYVVSYLHNYQVPQSNTTFTGVTSVVWNSINLLAVVLIIVAASAILAYFGFGRSVE